jgi:hypothetical protein
MLVCMLFTFSIGIEGGYSIPAVGFKNISAGTSFSIVAVRSMSIIDVTLAGQTSFYTGNNSAYHMNATGVRLGMQKSNWPISPVLAIGVDHISRDLNQNREAGFVAAYSLGFIINLHIDQLHIYPKFYYDGLTDMKVHAGFIGLKLGVGYEI